MYYPLSNTIKTIEIVLFPLKKQKNFESKLRPIGSMFCSHLLKVAHDNAGVLPRLEGLLALNSSDAVIVDDSFLEDHAQKTLFPFEQTLQTSLQETQSVYAECCVHLWWSGRLDKSRFLKLWDY